MAHQWDPQHYLRYADERGRPFVELLARIDAIEPRAVVDLGCGPGNLTSLLAQRWPGAKVTGVDSSAEMITRARTTEPAVEFVQADLREWQPASQVDVLVSNATLQWIPGHRALLPRLVEFVADDGWFAFQVPGNFTEPSHTLRQEIAAQERYAAHLTGVVHPDSDAPADYLTTMQAIERVTAVDVWETTYLHVLRGADAVFEWVSATGARPTLQALPTPLREQFADEFRAALRAAYPLQPDGTVILPFRRIFAVARIAEHRPA